MVINIISHNLSNWSPLLSLHLLIISEEDDLLLHIVELVGYHKNLVLVVLFEECVEVTGFPQPRLLTSDSPLRFQVVEVLDKYSDIMAIVCLLVFINKDPHEFKHMEHVES